MKVISLVSDHCKNFETFMKLKDKVLASDKCIGDLQSIYNFLAENLYDRIAKLDSFFDSRYIKKQNLDKLQQKIDQFKNENRETILSRH